MLVPLTPIPAATEAGVGLRAGLLDDAAVPGLVAPARIVRDRQGVAHIDAGNDHDLYLLQGWVHASDRLFQMDLNRRRASGRQAELLGPAALAEDVQLRTLGLRRAAEVTLPALSAETRRHLDAYAEGVNAWVAKHHLPGDYAEVEVTTFEPWTPVDSVVAGKLISFGLSFDLDVDRTLDQLAYRGIAAPGVDGARLFSEVNRSQPFDPAATVPDATVAPARPTAPSPATPLADAGRSTPAAEMGRRYLEAVEGMDLLEDAVSGDRRTGSNEWGIAGSHSASGRPMIANDPHLSLDVPSTFYPIRLAAPSQDVIGEGFPGLPGVVLGTNRSITWGATTNPLDVTDTFLETLVADPASPSGLSTVYQGGNEHVVAIPEQFRVNHRSDGADDQLALVPPGRFTSGSVSVAVPDRTLIVPRRYNGPIVQRLDGQALSVQYTGWGVTRELETFLAWNRAEDLDDFKRGLETFDVGSQNWAYADVHGNLAYFTSAEHPLREDLEAGRVEGNPPWLIRSGAGGNEWLPVRNPQPGQAVPFEVLPQVELPQVVNPPSGFFVNANNDPAGTTLDGDPLNQRRPTGGIFYLNPGYDGGFRAGRITDAIQSELAGGGKVSFGEMQAIQADTRLLDAQVLKPFIQAAFARATAPGAHPALRALGADPRVAEAVARLATWDTSTPTGIAEGYDAADVDGRRLAPSGAEVANSVAATVYSVWRGQVLQDVVDAPLQALGVDRPTDDQALATLRVLLERFDAERGVLAGVEFFAVPGVDDAAARRDVRLLSTLVDALDLLAGDAFAPAFGRSANQDDYRWGRLHRITFDNPLGGERNVPPAGGIEPSVPGLPGVATDGGFDVVDASGHSARADAADEFGFGGGPVRRFVGEAQPRRIRAVSSLPGGTSSDPASPFYANLLPGWLTNDTYVQTLRPPVGTTTRHVPAPRRAASTQVEGETGQGLGGTRTPPRS